MRTNTKEKIFEYIAGNNPCTINILKNEFNISNQIIHRHILKLIEEGKIYKSGSAPKVFYFPNKIKNVEMSIYGISKKEKSKKEKLKKDAINGHLYNNKNEKNYFNEKFLYSTKKGELKYGFEGFKKWVKDNDLDLEKEIIIFKEYQLKYDNYRNKFGFIKGKEKFKQTFDDVYLDNVYYLDFLSIEKYGKTYLGNLIITAKQKGDKQLIKNILNYIKKPIDNLIKRKKIDAICFIPPGIIRKVQLINELEQGLGIKDKGIKILKINKEISISQDKLDKKEAKLINARDSIFIQDNKFKCNNILLIDDTIGSGSTLNETARKIKDKKIAKKVFGLAIVGSFDGFEKIKEI